MVATSSSTNYSRGRSGPVNRINNSPSSDWSVGSGKGSSILRAAHARRSPSPSRTVAAVNKYNSPHNHAQQQQQRTPNAGNSTAASSVRSNAQLSRGSTPQERFQNMQKTNAGSNKVSSYPHPPTTPDFPRVDSLDSFDGESMNTTMNTELFRKFEEAFNVTLRNNPTILPGAPAVMKSIKTTLFKVQQGKVAKVAEMRRQLDEAKGEITNMDQHLGQQREELARKKTEYTREMADIEAATKDLKGKVAEARKDKDEMAKHLDFLSKSRADVEKALKVEVKKLEKERDALLKVSQERKRIQKVQEENMNLKGVVDGMSEEASKEKQELNEKKEMLKQMKEKNEKIRNESETVKKEIEMEQKGLLEINVTIQAKKAALLENKKESQEKLNELETELAEAKKEAQDQMNELKIELAKTKLSSGVKKTVTSLMSPCDGGNDQIDELEKELAEAVTQDQLNGLKAELAKTKLSSGMKKTVTSLMTRCDGGDDQNDDSHARPSSSRNEDKVDGAGINVTPTPRAVVFDSNLPSPRYEDAQSPIEDVARKERSRSRSRSRRSRSRSKSQRRWDSKRVEEEEMGREIEILRLELEEVRARNNVAMREQEAAIREQEATIREQEAREAENALREEADFMRNEIRVNEAEGALRDQLKHMDTIRTEMRSSRRNSLGVSPSAYTSQSPSFRRSHRDRDHEERYYSFLHKDREPTSSPPHTSRTSRRFRLENDDDRPRTSRNTFSRSNFSSPLASSSSRRPFSDRAARSTPEWRR